jgi:hypothetical protein
MHNFHDVQKNFPPGNITDGRCCGTKGFGNWAIYILPYLEQQALSEMYNDKGGLGSPFSSSGNIYNDDPVNLTVTQTNAPFYSCPADVNIGRIDLVPASNPAQSRDRPWRTGSYRGVAGRHGINNQANFDSTEAETLKGPNTALGWGLGWRGPLHTLCRAPGSPCPGMMPSLKQESTATILDGTSNTLMVGEYSTMTTPRRTTFWAYSYASYSLSSVSLQTRTLLSDYEKCKKIDGPSGEHACKRAWGSFHAGPLINFALCDGSVRGFSTNVSMQILASLATVAGGEAVSLPN